MFRLRLFRPFLRQKPRVSVVHLHRVRIKKEWVKRTVTTCIFSYICLTLTLDGLRKKLSEVELPDVPEEEEELANGIFIPLPMFRTMPPSLHFSRGSPEWERFEKFLANNDWRNRAYNDVLRKVQGAFTAPNASLVPQLGPIEQIRGNLTPIFTGHGNPEPYQLGLVLFANDNGPLLRRRLVERGYQTRVERLFYPQAVAKASWAFVSCLWQLTVVQAKQAMGVEASPVPTTMPPSHSQIGSFGVIPIWNPEPQKPTLPSHIPGRGQPTTPGMHPGLVLGSRPRPRPATIILPGGAAGPANQVPSSMHPDGPASAGGNETERRQSDPAPRLTDEDGNPLMPQWLATMIDIRTHEPLLKRLRHMSQMARSAFVMEIAKHPSWNRRNTADFPPPGSIILMGPVVIQTKFVIVHLDVTFWYDPVAGRLVQDYSSISLKGIGARPSHGPLSRTGPKAPPVAESPHPPKTSTEV